MAETPGPSEKELADARAKRRKIAKKIRKTGPEIKRRGERVRQLKKRLGEDDHTEGESLSNRRRGILEANLERHSSRRRAAKEHAEALREKYKNAGMLSRAADPGEVTPVINPFMTADDIMDANEAEQERAGIYSDLDFELEAERADNEYQKTEIDKGAIAQRAGTSDSMSSRGLFHSSIRDAELYDISATAGLRRNDLDRQLDTSATDAQRQKLAADSAFNQFQLAMKQRMVENAQEASKDSEPWVRDPLAGYNVNLGRYSRKPHPNREPREHDRPPRVRHVNVNNNNRNRSQNVGQTNDLPPSSTPTGTSGPKPHPLG